jgi:putative membrane protein
MKLIIRWVVTAFSLFVANWALPGIRVEGKAWVVYAIMAVVLGLINAVIRPILKFLSCPLIILTLGLFVFIINGLLLWFASYVADKWLNVGFHIDNFASAFLGALIVSIVSVLLSFILREELKKD